MLDGSFTVNQGLIARPKAITLFLIFMIAKERCSVNKSVLLKRV